MALPPSLGNRPYPSLPIRFRAGSLELEARALLDTGFDGHLAVPEALIARLPSPARRQRARLVAGQVVPALTYVGHMEFTAQPGYFDALIIALGDEYLVGLSALNRFSVTLDHGERVVLDL